MSRYEEERGEWTLPAAEASKLKKRLREVHNGRRDRALAEAKAWWRKNRTASRKKYSAALDRDTMPPPTSGWGRPRDPVLSEDAAEVLAAANGSRYGYGWADGKDHNGQPLPALRGPQVADVDRALGEKATNKTSLFRVGHEASIRFDGAHATWQVPSNNHAVETARDDPMARAFFAALEQVKWTARTGGKSWGQDEYNSDAAMEYGSGGGPYETGVWGNQKKIRDLQFAQMTGQSTKSGRVSRATGFKCGHATTAGRACQRPVVASGDRCPAHR